MAESSEEPDVKRRKLSSSSRATNASTISTLQTEPSSSGFQSAKPQLQSDFSIVQFAECRARELIAMHKISRAITGNKLPQQTIPRHMRRRAASHNMKRLPRRLRQAALRENLRNPRASTKRPSRKHRRRPSNLLQEYLRRQRSKKWLETHIWHAKRFHMTERWGYKLPLHPNDKGARAAYRASAKHCLLQDLSFLTCVEIKGTQSDVAERLNRLTSRDVGLRFGAAAYKKGQREGSIVVYEVDKYPHCAIGPVQFMWKPSTDNSEVEPGLAVLWIWVHPALLNVFLRNILIVLDIKPVSVDVNANKDTVSGADQKEKHIPKSEEKNSETNNCDESDKKNTSVAKSAKKTQINADDSKLQKTETENSADSNNTKGNVAGINGTLFRNEDFSAQLLDNELCRFQLTGPLSQVVLARTLEVTSVNISKNVEQHNGLVKSDLNESESVTSMSVLESSSTAEDTKKSTLSKNASKEPNAVKDSKDDFKKTISKESKESKWWQKYFAQDNMSEVHEDQCSAWSHMCGVLSPAELAPHCVLGLTVTDPRLQLPAMKGKTYPDIDDWNADSSSSTQEQWSPELSYSPLWEESVRREVAQTKLSEQQMNDLRAKLLVPGSRLDLGDEASRVPVLLVQHPGNQPLDGASRTGLGCGWDIILPARWAMAFWVPLVYRGARVCGLKDSAELCASQGTLHFPTHYPDTDAGQRHQNDVTTEQLRKYNRKPASKRTNYLKYGVAAPFNPPWKQLVRNWSTTESRSDTERQNKDKCADSEGNVDGADLFVLRDRRILKALSSLYRHQNRKQIAASDTKMVESVFNADVYNYALVPVQIEMTSKGRPSAMSMICVPTAQDLNDINLKDCKPPVEPKHKVPRISVKAKTKAKTKELKKKRQENLEEKQKKAVENVRAGCTREVAGFVCSGGFDLPSGYGSGVGFITLPALKVLMAQRDRIVQKTKQKGRKSESIKVLVRNTTSLKYRCAHLNVFHSSVKLC